MARDRRRRRRGEALVGFTADGHPAGPGDPVSALVAWRTVRRSARRPHLRAASALQYLAAGIAVCCLLATSGLFVVGWWLSTPDLRLAWGVGAWALIVLGWMLKALETPRRRRP